MYTFLILHYYEHDVLLYELFWVANLVSAKSRHGDDNEKIYNQGAEGIFEVCNQKSPLKKTMIGPV